jgi:DedD protein
VNRSYDSDDDLQDPGSRDREISLGTTTILGIFFALALLCALFFGFGYSMGRRSAQTVAGASAAAATNDTANAKPAPGSPASRALAASRKSDEAADGDGVPTTNVDSAASSTATGENVSPATTATRPQISRSDPSAQPAANSSIKPVSMPRPAAATSAPPVPVAVPGMGSAVVQVAAVSHQEDADVLMSALKKHGYNVAIRQEPQDKLLHVQVGPFASRKDAEAMRQRLLADGYNAIVK